MVSLQAQPPLDVFQLLLQRFYDLKQKVSESTLWICDRGIAQPLSLDLQETGSLLILQIQLQPFKGSLDLQITPETVLVSGERLDPLEAQIDSNLALTATRFQSLIPLPSAIQPQTAIAELGGTTLTLTLMKAHEAQRTAKLTVGDRAQPLPYAMAVSATAVSVTVAFHEQN